MSKDYDMYIKEHKENVAKAFDWLSTNLSDIFRDAEFLSECEHLCKFGHDQSKYNPEEYEAYDEYFYGKNRSYAVVQNFNKAWLLHIHNNPHHWQYWILINDNPFEGEIILDMPDEYIIEMICDWWSFSFRSGDLTEIFRWYEEREKYMKLSDETRGKIAYILERIKEKLPESD